VKGYRQIVNGLRGQYAGLIIVALVWVVELDLIQEAVSMSPQIWSPAKNVFFHIQMSDPNVLAVHIYFLRMIWK
jgi:hypothetical protein